jgi:hypothetical protein
MAGRLFPDCPEHATYKKIIGVEARRLQQLTCWGRRHFMPSGALKLVLPNFLLCRGSELRANAIFVELLSPYLPFFHHNLPPY